MEERVEDLTDFYKENLVSFKKGLKEKAEG
jgi:hypothetical protein